MKIFSPQFIGVLAAYECDDGTAGWCLLYLELEHLIGTSIGLKYFEAVSLGSSHSILISEKRHTTVIIVSSICGIIIRKQLCLIECQFFRSYVWFLVIPCISSPPPWLVHQIMNSRLDEIGRLCAVNIRLWDTKVNTDSQSVYMFEIEIFRYLIYYHCRVHPKCCVCKNSVFQEGQNTVFLNCIFSHNEKFGFI